MGSNAERNPQGSHSTVRSPLGHRLPRHTTGTGLYLVTCIHCNQRTACWSGTPRTKKEHVIEHLRKLAARHYHPDFINSPGDLAVASSINAWIFVLHALHLKPKGCTVIEDRSSQDPYLHQNFKHSLRLRDLLPFLWAATILMSSLRDSLVQIHVRTWQPQ